MISRATLNVSSKESVKLVRNANLLGNFNNSIVYPDHMPGELRSLTYEKSWEKCTHNSWFNIQLDDGSLLIFKEGSYTYLMTPVKTLSYEEYINTYYPEDDWGNSEEYQVMIIQEYDNYIDSHTKNFPPMPVRYDIDSKHYCEHSHPYCHFHFGSENEGRVATKKILTPISFTAFILRSFYPKAWKIYSESTFIQEHVHFFKESLDSPSADYWKDHENNFLFVG